MPTPNERCAKCLGWTVTILPPETHWYIDKSGKKVMRVRDFHPDTDRNHSQLMVDAVREAGKLEKLCDNMAVTCEDNYGALDPFQPEYYKSEICFLLATPAQISKAAREVLEQ